MTFPITARYLCLPVDKKSPVVKLHFYSDGQKFQEADISLGTDDNVDFYSAMDVEKYVGKTIEIAGEIPAGAGEKIHCQDKRPATEYAFRPQIHFAAETGWINDPNGLIYANGVYHLYHQWNPFGTEWGNMHWGHGVSQDMITWEHRPMAMEPDEYGTAYSGCAWQDRENTAGFGKDALLFLYTASGGCNQWSIDAGNQHTQRLAVSTDGGESLEKHGLVLDHIMGGNRDPKVFYHEESAAYVMVLFLDGNEFAIFRSQDLLHWTESQRFTADKMWECPDLFRLEVDNALGAEVGEKKWVFWSADGYYMVGEFDGYRFTPETEVLTAYSTDLGYAAQTFAGIEGRTVSVAWLRTENHRGNFRGMMSIPTELSLMKVDGGWKMCFRPVREIWKRFSKYREHTVENGKVAVPMGGKPVIAVINWKSGEKHIVKVGATEMEVGDSAQPLTLIVDHGIVEYFGDGGTVYGSMEAEEDVLSGEITVGSDAENICVFEML